MVKSNNNGANLGFEQKLWLAADKMRSNMDAAEYKHVVLGLIFLKYISDAFTEVYKKLKKEKDSDPEDVDETFQKILTNEYQIQNLSQVRDSLLPRLMSGKIRVPIEVKL